MHTFAPSAVACDNLHLCARAHLRVDEMFDRGLCDEVCSLDLDPDSTAAAAIGLHEAMHELELRRTITTLMSRPDHSKLLSGGLSDI